MQWDCMDVDISVSDCIRSQVLAGNYSRLYKRKKVYCVDVNCTV